LSKYVNFIIIEATGNVIVILDYPHFFRVTCTRCRIDTINSPDDGHVAAKTCRE